jgi:hypothetical protein
MPSAASCDPIWFPAPAAKTLAETGAPTWAVETFDRLRTANGGTLRGFFDVFAWREPGQVRFCEAKVGPDRIKATQIRFLEVALRFYRPADFMIIEVAGPSMPGVAGRRSKSASAVVHPCLGALARSERHRGPFGDAGAFDSGLPASASKAGHGQHKTPLVRPPDGPIGRACHGSSSGRAAPAACLPRGFMMHRRRPRCGTSCPRYPRGPGRARAQSWA